LRALAHLGFVNESLRRRAWPLLLEVPQGRDEDGSSAGGGSAADEEKEEGKGGEAQSSVRGGSRRAREALQEQVEKDVNRSLHHFDVTQGLSEAQRAVSRQSLQRIITGVIGSNRELHYIQGFHDVCSVFLLVCGEDLGYKLVERLTRLHLRDSLRANLDTVVQVLSLLYPLLEQADREVHDFLQRASVMSFFALSWVLTWFSHDLERFSDVQRIFDFLLASHPLMSLYVAASVIIHRRRGLLALAPEHTEIHSFLRNVPADIDVDSIIATARRLFSDYPPSTLRIRAGIELPPDSPVVAADALELQKTKERRVRRWRRLLAPVASVVVAAVATAVAMAVREGWAGGT
jgi:hypothetical protein